MASRVTEVWDRLLGLYGSGLIRRFGKSPPDEWANLLGQLTDMQLRHGLEQLVKSGRAMPPSLPEFLALCRTAKEWAKPIMASAQLEDCSFDKWDREANQHMLAEVLRAAHHRKYFTEEATRTLLEWKHAWARDCRDADQGEGVPRETQKIWWNDCMQRAREAGAVAVR